MPKRPRGRPKSEQLFIRRSNTCHYILRSRRGMSSSVLFLTFPFLCQSKNSNILPQDRIPPVPSVPQHHRLLGLPKFQPQHLHLQLPRKGRLAPKRRRRSHLEPMQIDRSEPKVRVHAIYLFFNFSPNGSNKRSKQHARPTYCPYPSSTASYFH